MTETCQNLLIAFVAYASLLCLTSRRATAPENNILATWTIQCASGNSFTI